jgi:ABC-2 type transport system ATP-binding protein
LQVAIDVSGVSKRFRLYHERNQSLKSTLLRRGRATFEEFWALQDVDFQVPEGSTFGLIGENGSGKSTLLKCMAKILRPDRGRISVEGKLSALLELGAGFHPELSGRENVYLNASILGLGKREVDRRFDAIVAFAGLEQFIDTPVKNYSSGMYVRLGFSVAINVEPDVLLVDEILAVGDEQFQRRCKEKFVDLKAEGKTIVVVSHALGSVRSLCDHAAWLEHGVLKEVGPAEHVVDAYIGSVDTVRVEGGIEARWGTGEARIERVELLDGRGVDVARVRTGEAMTVRLHYSLGRPIERPVFTVTIHRIDGVHVCAPTTRDAGCVPDVLAGWGYVDLRVDRLLLLPGSYDVSVSITDDADLQPFDVRPRALRFEVDPGEPREAHGGIASLDGRWEIRDLERRA